MKDNVSRTDVVEITVVNCFQKLLSSWWRTTTLNDVNPSKKLWIAFKNYYLRDEGQLETTTRDNNGCCELLSKIIIFVMKDNRCIRHITTESVVNCFQKLLSSWWRTTFVNIKIIVRMLWIAFKNYYLRDEGQLSHNFIIFVYSCELLSKIIIFVMKDNSFLSMVLWPTVVNCFQKLLSSWWRTTKK